MIYIYGLFDPRNLSLRYIGKTDNLERRLDNHIHHAKIHMNHNPHKDRWIRQLLTEGLVPAIEVLEECNQDNWESIEDAWIQEARAKGANLVNIMNGGQGGSVKGRKLSEQAKDKISKGLKGRKFSEEHKRKIGEASKGNLNFLGRKHSEETKSKMSESNKGVSRGKGIPKSKETIEKMRLASKGRKLSEEAKGKISQARMGKSLSDEHKESLRLAARNRPIATEETRKKISESNRGRKFSEEHRRNLSISQKGKHMGKDSSFYGKNHSEATKKKQSLIRKMNIAYQKQDINKVIELQKQYMQSFNIYYPKYLVENG